MSNSTNQGNQSSDHKSIKEQIDRATLSVTIVSTIVAVLAAAAAFWSGWEAHETRVADERPILRVEPINADGARPLRTVIDDHIVAQARFPAKSIRVICITAIDDPPDSVRWNESWGVAYTFPSIFPEVWVKSTCPLQANFNPIPNARVIQLGVVRYKDVADTEYITPFCFTYTVIPPDSPSMPNVSICNDFRGLPEMK